MHPYERIAMAQDYTPVDLTDYFEDQDWGFSEDARDDIPSVFLDQFITEEGLLALPFAPQASVLFYNRSWANTLGFSEPPQDEVAFRAQSRDAILANLEDLNEENDGLGGWIISYDPKALLSWFHAFGGDLPVDATPAFDNDAGVAAFRYLKSTYDEGYIWLSRQPEPYPYFADRNALMYSGTLDQIPEQQGWMTLESNTDDWGVIGYPGSERITMLVDSPGLMVSAGTPAEQMASWLFAKFLLEPQVQAEIVQSLFTLPARQSAVSFLPEFIEQYPQWAEAVDLIDISAPIPIAEGWGIAQWVLQDAAYRMFPFEDVNIPALLEQLDATVNELLETEP
jgi:multiple sugar transport system substrate-binding protein